MRHVFLALLLLSAVYGCSSAPPASVASSASPSPATVGSITASPSLTPRPSRTTRASATPGSQASWPTADVLMGETTRLYGIPWLDAGTGTRANVSTLTEFMTELQSTTPALVLLKEPTASPANGYMTVTGTDHGIGTLREVLNVLEPEAVGWAIAAVAAAKDRDIYASPRGSIIAETTGGLTTFTFTPAR